MKYSSESPADVPLLFLGVFLGIVTHVDGLKHCPTPSRFTSSHCASSQINGMLDLDMDVTVFPRHDLNPSLLTWSPFIVLTMLPSA